MDWGWFLFRFERRINRARIWLATLVMICWALFLVGLIADVRALAGGPAAFKFNADEFLDPAIYRSLSLAGLPLLGAKLVMTVLFMWVYLATSVKRLHDRDRSGWWILAFFIPPSLGQKLIDQLPDSFLLSAAQSPGQRAGHLGLYRNLHPARQPRHEPVRRRPAGRARTGLGQAGELGPAERAGICPAQC